MALSATMRVKISSEAAGYVSLTPVVIEEMATAALLEEILGVTGHDAPRVLAVLRRGTLTSGASRFRWATIDVGPDELDLALAALPHAEPTRPFDATRCQKAVLVAPAARLEIAREVASQRRMLRRASFWGHLLARAARTNYAGYLYAQRADVYRVELDRAELAGLTEATRLLRYSGLARQVRARAWTRMDLIVGR